MVLNNTHQYICVERSSTESSWTDRRPGWMPKLRDHQAGFRKDRSSTNQIATLRIIVEQSMEWDSSLYINFVDYEKAFDSLDRDTLWKLLQHCGIPDKCISLLRITCEGMACRVIHI